MRLVVCTIEVDGELTPEVRAAICEAALRPTVALLPEGDQVRIVSAPDDVIEAAVDAILAAGRAARVTTAPLGDATEQDARHVAVAVRTALGAVEGEVAKTTAEPRAPKGPDPLAACEPFLAAVAAATPLPAGGSSAALTGATAAALVEMTARLTIGREAYADVQKEMAFVAETAERLRRSLHGIVRRDTDAYQAFMDAMRLPRATPEEAQTRRQALARAALEASEIPLETMRLCVSVLEKANVAARKGNRNAGTDAAVAAVLAGAAGRAAWMNVRANLPAVKDVDRRSRLSGEAASLKTVLEDLTERTIRSAETRDE